MRILITGSSGLLGSAMAHLASERRHEVYSAYNQHLPKAGTPIKLDLTDLSSIKRVVRKIRPHAIVHAAALTDVDRCELDKDLALRVNFEASAEIASAANKAEAFLVYISTDYVFNGEKGLYSEEDAPEPVNFYGYTKLKAEESVSESFAEYCIARPSVIYGPTPASGKVNFALWLIEKLRMGEKIDVLTDQHVSPTLNLNLAEMILEIVERRIAGTYHLAGAERVSRYDFAMKICEIFGFDSSPVNPARMQDMVWLAKRPRDSSLDVSKAAATLRAKPLKLDEAISALKGEVLGFA